MNEWMNVFLGPTASGKESGFGFQPARQCAVEWSDAVWHLWRPKHGEFIRAEKHIGRSSAGRPV